MRSFEQLAESAYQAYVEEGKRLPFGDSMPPWQQLGSDVQACFVAATKQLWTEFTAIH